MGPQPPAGHRAIQRRRGKSVSGVGYASGDADLFKQITTSTPQPVNIMDSREGTVLLHTGDFVVFQLQFSVGDGKAISKDWEALNALESIFVPWSPWHGLAPLGDVAASLPTVQCTLSGSAIPSSGKLLHAPFDHIAVHEYFADYIEHDEDTYIRSHFGVARANIISGTDQTMDNMANLMLSRIDKSGNLKMFVEQLWDAGMEELALKFCPAL